MKNLIPKPIRLALRRLAHFIMWDSWVVRSWSQEGEDLVLNRIFEQQKSGFYVDVGAHHPKRFSNTYLFYQRGWRGINLDAMPGSMKAFRKFRPRDINIEIGIGEHEEKLDYFVFNEPALNGFSKDLSEERTSPGAKYKIEKVIKVDVSPLNKVLDRHLPIGQKIDFMSIDVEGLDLKVLKSNDWQKYRPTYVLAEVLGSSLHEIAQSDVGRFMRSVDYVLYAKCMNTVFFKESLSQ
jgi:FkbM family methyltransferase